MAISGSIVRRYFLFSLLVSIVPVVSVGLLFDRYAQGVFNQIVEERLSAQLTATARRLEAFVDARRYQAETLANYPAVIDLDLSASAAAHPDRFAMLQVESDGPDLYGILFFAADGRLARVVAGQAASGAPYWQDAPFSLAGLPVTAVDATTLVGPRPPSAGASGWLLVRHPLRSRGDQKQHAAIALHVRLASLTELMGGASVAGVLQPVLRTPAGYFDSVGQPVTPSGRLIPGPEFLPGWQPMLLIDPSELLRPFTSARRVLLFAVFAAAALVIFIFYRLARRLRDRVDELTRGTQAIASGQLDYRIRDRGNDEIATVSRAFNRMADSLQDMFARLVKMERLAMMGEFATSIAHEVRNPLAAIKTTVQALGRREEDPKKLRLLKDVESEVARLGRVADDLSDFGRPHPATPAAVPVHEVLRRVETLTAPEAEKRGVTVASQGDSALALWADEDHLLQILLNLTLNAIQATPTGGLVTLRAQRNGERGEIEVSDNGCGIPPETLPRVGDPFFTTKPRGMGLGLSICRQLAELNHGTLDISSVVERGTTVSLRLPLPGAPAHA